MSSDENRDQAATWSQRTRARERGDLPISREFASTLALIAGLALLAFVAAECWAGLCVWMKDLWRWPGGEAMIELQATDRLFPPLGRSLLVLASSFCLISFAAGWIQTGCGLFWSRLQWDVGRLHPARYWERARSAGFLVGSLLALVRWLLVWLAILACLWFSRNEIVAVGAASSEQWLGAAALVVFSIVIKTTCILGVLGLADYGLQWWWHERRLAMGPDELRQEMRAARIDPQVAQRRRSLGRAFIEHGLDRLVRSADFLVTDETGAVIGLSLSDRDDELPRVVLRGGADQTTRVQQLAIRRGVPVYQHSVAAAMFARCRVDGLVPVEFVGILQALHSSSECELDRK